MVTDRGAHEEIDVFPGFPLENKLSGNVVDLCPVGALGDKDFLYQQRVWFMKPPGFGLRRLQHRMLDLGGRESGSDLSLKASRECARESMVDVRPWPLRLEVRSRSRSLLTARRRASVGAAAVIAAPGATTAEEGPVVDAQDLVPAVASLLDQAITLVISPWMTVEEAYLAASWARAQDTQARLAMGPIPCEGQDEQFAKGFTIRAEKCPNRRGVEIVLDHFGDWLDWEQLLQTNQDDPHGALWILGGYPTRLARGGDGAAHCRRANGDSARFVSIAPVTAR